MILNIMNRMRRDYNIEGVILGCTELPMLIKQADMDIPVFDTAAIHAKAIVDFALKS
jgi:aspartate racemase